MRYKSSSLKDLISFISKGIVPKYANSYDENVIRVINQRCNRNGEITFREARYSDLSKRKVTNEKLLKNKDILINSTGKGTAGRVAQISENQLTEPTTVDGHMIIIRPSEKIDPDYLGYALKAQQRIIENYAEGSTGQTEINKQRLLDETIIKYPSKEEQRKIANIFMNLDMKIKNNQKINTNLFNLMSITFENLYTSNRYNKNFTLNELVSETLTGEWGKEKIIDSFNKKATIIRGADFLDVSKGLKGNTPVRFLKANAYDKKFLQANDVLVEISGGSPTQSTGRSLLITTQVLDHFTTKTFGTNFTRNFRLKTSEDAILFKSYIQFLYDIKLFFNYENGTTGIKNLDYKSVLKIPLPDFRDTCDFQYYLKSYTKYYSLIQQLGLENNKLLKIKNILLQKYF
ncbi:hypothetical protein LSGJ_01680 [Ligilactobacillus salivarius GJ-24]|uniref:Type I restriction modification DNA specificity domain-containing protein n=1 Tax=Ligilactobacillus salivarius GJ-24 TaxID=1041521 RepID=F7QX39_9LACO|nr:restriction endonuclease subunit S [Ligilactobacillus salivarius]EGM49618.1 hypothetical protein LSGJ_01680 [Ligilactobacillus salivarius GJ-24]